jgi:hypothetical protein
MAAALRHQKSVSEQLGAVMPREATSCPVISSAAREPPRVFGRPPKVPKWRRAF